MSERSDADHIRSYVQRATRMSAAQRRSWDELRERYCVEPGPAPFDPALLFPSPQRPVVLEIGFGMGEATAEIAVIRPDHNFLGAEVHRPGVGRLLWLLDSRGIGNVRIVTEDAIPLLERMAAGSLDGVHLFFPDPWPKKRHHKRRLVRPSVARLLADRLKEGGYLYMVTDWEHYAEQALEILGSTAGLRNPYGRYAPRREWRSPTAFERKGLAAGRMIRELFFVRASDLRVAP